MARPAKIPLRASSLATNRQATSEDLRMQSNHISSGDKRLILTIVREIKVLMSLRGCRNIVQWHDDIGLDTRLEYVHLHMDNYNGGDLQDLIKS
jgi:serine/threonine protein kinase